MNRILFEKDEISGGIAKCGGARAEHILNVLHGEVGQRLKTGEIGGKVGTGEIISVLPGGSAFSGANSIRLRQGAYCPWKVAAFQGELL